MKKKRFVSALLVAAITGAMLTGCGSDSSSEGSEESKEEKKTIRISTTGEHAFFSETNEDGELQGFEIDVWNEIADRLNYEIADQIGLYVNDERVADVERKNTILQIPISMCHIRLL